MFHASLRARTWAALLLTAATLAGQSAPPPAESPDPFALPATDDGLPGAGPLRRMDWFQRLWRERRASWAKRVAQDRGALVFLGDSITQGWGNGMNVPLPGIEVANRGISGDTTRGVLLRLQDDVLALNPRGVVLLIGTNDIEEQAAPETIAGNLELILDALRQHNPAMPVVLCAVFPSSDTKKRPKEKIQKLNQLYFAAIADKPQVTWLDTWSLFADARGNAKPEEFPDLLHPNALGYAKWGAALRPVLETVGLAPAWPDDFQPEPGFESLFNGRDLTGWTYEGQPPLDGRTDDPDGRFRAVNGRLVATAARLERKWVRIVTAREFPRDFVLRLEFRASPNADSGIYIRNPQIQCRDYHIAGPYITLQRYRPLEWNAIEVVVRGGLARATCNGEVLFEAMPIPATGPIGLENDRGQVEYRRIRIREVQ